MASRDLSMDSCREQLLPDLPSDVHIFCALDGFEQRCPVQSSPKAIPVSTFVVRQYGTQSLRVEGDQYNILE